MTTRLPGILCTSRLGADWIDDGTLNRTRSGEPGSLGKMSAQHGPFDIVFKVCDDLTGQPIANTPYRITLESGPAYFGVTDGLGFTGKVGADRAQIATLEIPYDGNSTSGADTGKQYDACGC